VEKRNPAFVLQGGKSAAGRNLGIKNNWGERDYDFCDRGGRGPRSRPWRKKDKRGVLEVRGG